MAVRDGSGTLCCMEIALVGTCFVLGMVFASFGNVVIHRVPQDRQRPRSSSHDSTGTLSIGATRTPQDGQALGGRTTDSPRGTRWMTTLPKEANTMPNTKQVPTSAISIQHSVPEPSRTAIAAGAFPTPQGLPAPPHPEVPRIPHTL